MDEKLKLLSEVPLLAGLDRKGLEEVGRLADEIDLAAGRVVARQGSSGDEFFVIIDGTVRIERNGELLRNLGPATSSASSRSSARWSGQPPRRVKRPAACS